jgi:hypothetical protein
MSEKNPLQVGDRVRVYGGYRCTAGPGNYSGGTWGVEGTVMTIVSTDCIQFKSDDDRCIHTAHPKQVRRLVPRKRREFILSRSSQGILGVTEIGLPVQNGERIRVREVFK